jgi:hypothetical protein
MLKKLSIFAVIYCISFQLSYADWNSFTVNVPNAQGGYTAIVIKQSGEGYLGPQGEYYAEFPKVSQLQAVYGLAPNPAVVTYTYAQPQVQSVVSTQIVYQVPNEDRDEEVEDYPISRPYMPENPPPSNYVEDNEWIIFKSHKKDKSKSQPSAPQNTNTVKPANPQQKNHTGQPPQKKNTQGSPQDKSIPQNKPGVSS